MLIVLLFVSYAHVNSVSLFLFLLVSGVGCGFCLWLFLDFSVYLFSVKAFATCITDYSDRQRIRSCCKSTVLYGLVLLYILVNKQTKTPPVKFIKSCIILKLLNFVCCLNVIVFHYKTVTNAFVIFELFSVKYWALNGLSAFAGYLNYLNIKK